MALFNNFPYSNTEDINLDYTLNKLNELYSRGENLYAELQAWKTETDEANEAWKSDLLSDINEWQNSVTHSLEEWKTSVDSEVSNALTTLSNQISAELAQAKTDLRNEVADLASAAAASAADATASQSAAAASAADATASQSAAAQSAQSAINSAAAAAQSEQNITESAEQIETNKNDITDLKSAFDGATVDGYNLIKIAENGVGAYYASGNTLTFNASYDDYHYAIIPVEKNSRYYVSISPRWWVLTDDDNNVLLSGAGFNPYTKRYIDTGNATKFYFTIDNGTWNNEITYGARFAIIISKCNTGSGSRNNVSKPEWLNGLSQRMCDSKYAFAFNRVRLKFTKNANKKFYFKNLLALDSNYVQIFIDSTSLEGITKDYVSITYTSTGEKAMFGRVYDVNLSMVEQQSDIKVNVADDNLSNCSALVIGDSTVEQNIMTQKMLDAFTERDKTLTLLGTRGTAPNLHEGRSGWSAKQYCTQSTDNPFYNNGFDFSHYMTAQGYSAVDFVVLQIGINDLYNTNLDDSDDKIAETMGYVCSMIDSILAWNESQKIIVNLLTSVNPNYTGDYMYVKRNIFVRYNAKMLLEITKYNLANVRPSDTFAILDPESDISDNVHPNAVGYEKMANEVVNQINCWQNV